MQPFNNFGMKPARSSVGTSAVISKLLRIIGYIVGAFFLLVTIALASTGEDTGGAVFIFIFFVVPFVLLIIQGHRIKNRIARFKIYIQIMTLQNTGSLQVFATQTNRTLIFVKKDVMTMIHKRYFVNAHINFSTMELVFAGSTPQPILPSGGFPHTPPMGPRPHAVPGQPAAQPESFICGGCGASGTKMQGVSVTCEYCGSVAT